jgi:hypothetical protein
MSEINVGSMRNSAIQQDSPGATQNYQVSVEQQTEMKAVVEGLLQLIDQLQLSQPDQDEIIADATTVKAQLTSSKPKWAIVTACLGDIRKKVIDLSVAGAAPAVLQQLETWKHQLAIFISQLGG